MLIMEIEVLTGEVGVEVMIEEAEVFQEVLITTEDTLLIEVMAVENIKLMRAE